MSSSKEGTTHTKFFRCLRTRSFPKLSLTGLDTNNENYTLFRNLGKEVYDVVVA